MNNPTSQPSGQPSGQPSFKPSSYQNIIISSQPTIVTVPLKIPYYVAAGVIAGVIVLSVCLYCCCCKTSINKRKIHQMMEEMKVDEKEDTDVES